MGISSFQVCMDPSECLQGTMSDDGGIDFCSPSSADMQLPCSRPLMERRLRPQHDQALNCPRCDSTNTKFCYYNNYSLSQPRYFCKTCRRYWTKGGTLRNIPVGGGCRRNKKSSPSTSKNPSDDHQNTMPTINHTDLQISHHLTSMIGAAHASHASGTNTSFLDNKYNAGLLDHIDRPNIDFLGGKFDALLGHGTASARGHDLLGSISASTGVDLGVINGGAMGDYQLNAHNINNDHQGLTTPINFINSPFGVDSYQGLMLPYEYDNHHANSNGHDNQSEADFKASFS